MSRPFGRRWHRWQVGSVRIRWYWGTHGPYHYGYKLRRNSLNFRHLHATWGTSPRRHGSMGSQGMGPRPEAHERITPEPVSRLDRAVRRIRFPAFIARRWYVCPACARVRRDPTDYCPRCKL